MQGIAGELEAQGRKGYVIPGGGSNALGALGYVACAHEIGAQSFELGVSFDRIIVASGSCGTHSGLLVGAKSINFDSPITGVNVRRARAEQEANLLTLAHETAALLQIEAPSAKDVTALDEWVGPGYSLPSDEMVEAVRMLARLEGVLLDPVYSGKAMAGLIGLCCSCTPAARRRFMPIRACCSRERAQDDWPDRRHGTGRDSRPVREIGRSHRRRARPGSSAHPDRQQSPRA
jgi:D-cysteine desulfhydrase